MSETIPRDGGRDLGGETLNRGILAGHVEHSRARKELAVLVRGLEGHAIVARHKAAEGGVVKLDGRHSSGVDVDRVHQVGDPRGVVDARNDQLCCLVGGERLM